MARVLLRGLDAWEVPEAGIAVPLGWLVALGEESEGDEGAEAAVCDVTKLAGGQDGLSVFVRHIARYRLVGSKVTHRSV